MNQVEALKKKAKTVNYAYIKLLQKYKFDNSEVKHYIFEGLEDQSFYFNYLQTKTLNYETYVSLGKKNSIDLYNIIDWTKYDKSRIIIFIDRDYDRLLGYPIPEDINIYETTYYSIENYICSVSVLDRMIREILHFHDGDAIKEILDLYNTEFEKYSNKLFPILIWIFHIRKSKLKANLNMIDISKLFAIDDNLKLKIIMTKNKISYLEKVTQIKTPNIVLSEIRHFINIFESRSCYKEYLRGKYEIWFLVNFFNKINKYLLKNHGHDSKMKTNVNISNSIEIIGPRVLIPQRLDEFLKII